MPHLLSVAGDFREFEVYRRVLTWLQICMHALDVAVIRPLGSGNTAGSRAPEARLIPHTGLTPCFLHGLSTRLVSAIASAPITTFRVSRGSITSSIIALPAAM